MRSLSAEMRTFAGVEVESLNVAREDASARRLHLPNQALVAAGG
jgi:hypothetical protein